MDSLLYVIEKDKYINEELREILKSNKNIRFVFLMGVDLGGNVIDEKIFVELFLEDIDKFLELVI